VFYIFFIEGDICTAGDVVDGQSNAIVALLRQAAAAWLLQRMSMDTLKEVFGYPTFININIYIYGHICNWVSLLYCFVS
jgi:hypothetical protein